jgi:hypothetical protein
MGDYAAIALSSFSTVQNVMGAQRQASAASAQGQYAKAVDYENARLSDLEAKDATDRGQLEAQRQGLATRQAIGSSRAALAAQGVDVSSGSAADVQASESAVGALDELTIRNNAAREAWGYKVQGIQQRREGDVAAITGDMTASGLRAQSWSDLLSGAAQTAYGIQKIRDKRTDLRTTGNRTGKP